MIGDFRYDDREKDPWGHQMMKPKGDWCGICANYVEEGDILPCCIDGKKPRPAHELCPIKAMALAKQADARALKAKQAAMQTDHEPVRHPMPPWGLFPEASVAEELMNGGIPSAEAMWAASELAKPQPAAMTHTLSWEEIKAGNYDAHLNLPTTPEARKALPICTGVVDYFPKAMAAVAECSRQGSKQHNQDQPLHWDRSKSTDHADCILRHLIDRGTKDTDGIRHSAKVAWRALALLEIELEKEAA